MSNKELTEDLLLIQQITARCEVNKEILARIRSYNLSPEPIALSISSFANPQYDHNYVQGVRLVQNPMYYRSDFLENPRSVVMHPVEDLFTDKLDYTVTKFRDLERLNTAMLPIVRKYRHCAPTAATIESLTQFKENYDRIHIALGKIEARCIKRARRRDLVNEQVERFNQQYKDLVAGIQQLSKAIANKTY